MRRLRLDFGFTSSFGILVGRWRGSAARVAMTGGGLKQGRAARSVVRCRRPRWGGEDKGRDEGRSPGVVGAATHACNCRSHFLGLEAEDYECPFGGECG